MNLDDLLKEMKEKMQKKDLSDEYLEKNGNTTRTEIGIGEYSYGITTIPCEWVYDFLLDYKRVLKENEELKNKLDNSRKANEFLNKKNDEIRREKSLMYSKAVNDIIKGWNLGDDFVPVQKIEDIIDRIDYDIKKTKEIISKNTNVHASYRKNDYQIVRLRAMNTKSLDIKKRLQKLLESEE